MEAPPVLTTNLWGTNNSAVFVETERTVKAESPEHLFVDLEKPRSFPDGIISGDTVTVRAEDNFHISTSPKKRKRQASDIVESLNSNGEKPDAAVSDGSRLTGHTHTRPYAPPKKLARSKDSRIKYTLT